MAIAQKVIECFVCHYHADCYLDLAEHILANTTTHKADGVLQWARRYKVGLRYAPHKKEKKVYTSANGICPVCHKTFEGKNSNEVCQC